MVFDSKLPTEDGRYRWREQRGSRIHVVTRKTRRGVTAFICSTMSAETLKSRGEWSPAEKAEAPGAEAI